MWNDTDIPLAYLITFRTYGTWLHGDERGSVNRFQNRYGSSRLPPNREWVKKNKERMVREPVKLDTKQRSVTEASIRETCRIRNWKLLAINVRTNHVHCVVSIGDKKPETALNALKANATKDLRLADSWNSSDSPWADKGSKRSLWNERSVEAAIDYVVNGQGGDLPRFEDL